MNQNLLDHIGKFSVILSYKHGGELRENALKNFMKCYDNQTNLKCELIVTEYVQGSDEPKFPFTNYCCAGQYTVLRNDKPFNKSWCMNIGARKATTNSLLFLDADILFGKDFFQRVIEFQANMGCYKQGRPFFNAYSWITCLPGKDNPVNRTMKYTKQAMDLAWFTKRDFLFDVLGGLNENYFGYGGEDNDIFIRATHILKKISVMDYAITHQYHDWAEPATSRINLIEYTTIDPTEVIEKLKKVNTGLNLETPNLIIIPENVIANKTSKDELIIKCSLLEKRIKVLQHNNEKLRETE